MASIEGSINTEQMTILLGNHEKTNVYIINDRVTYEQCSTPSLLGLTTACDMYNVHVVASSGSPTPCKRSMFTPVVWHGHSPFVSEALYHHRLVGGCVLKLGCSLSHTLDLAQHGHGDSLRTVRWQWEIDDGSSAVQSAQSCNWHSPYMH